MRIIAMTCIAWLATCQLTWADTGLAPIEILVKFRDAPSSLTRKAAVSRAASLGSLRDIGHNTHVLTPSVMQGHAGARRSTALSTAMNQQLATLRADPTVEYAEPNYFGEFADMPAAITTPNDPAYASAWWLDAVRARHAWALSSGQGVIVAVIDSGVDLTHPELQANLLPGYNFGDNNHDPQDSLGHGTRVAGIIGAVRDNQIAASGLAPQAKLLPIKINPGASGTFTTSSVAQAVDYAIAQGAKVINISLNIDQDTQTLELAIRRAQAAGVIVVVAAGNSCAAGAGVKPPAGVSDVIAVAATNQDGSFGSYSCVGPEVAIAAPGTALYTTLNGGGSGSSSSGTSFSAPIVSAAVANLLALDPRLPPGRIKALLAASSTPVQASTRSFGILDIGSAAQGLLADVTPTLLQQHVSLAYVLPITGGAINAYLSLLTPVGEFSLLPDGSWQSGSNATPIASGDVGSQSQRGNLFGVGGIFAPITITGLPSGRYVWRSRLTNASNGNAIGPIIESPIILP